jgi:hypothetical protein
MWLRTARRKRAHEEKVVPTQEQQSIAMRESSGQLVRAAILMAVSSLGFVFVGTYNAIGYFLGGILLVGSVLLYRYARRFR